MNTIQRCKPLLGTYVEVQLAGDMSQDALLELSSAMFAAIEHVETLMSFHNPDSELSLLNRTAHQRSWAVSDEMQQVLNQALLLSEVTDGLYDISIAPELVRNGLLPDHGEQSCAEASWLDISLHDGRVKFACPLQLDLGGIAKGFAVDQAMAVLPEDVVAIVNAGGDLRMSHWQHQPVSIRIPGQQHEAVELEMQAPAVATSACYYLDGNQGAGSAIFSKQSRQLVLKNTSYSVFADSCMLADALTKVVYLAPQETDWLKQFNASAMVLDESACVQQLAG